MSEFGIVEDTMFIPMVGRIYASEKFPGILYDKKALSLKEKLPSALLETGNQSQYTLLASASRSANMDRHIQNFLKRKPDGVVIQLGCGLETTYDRNDNGQTQWYAVDLIFQGMLFQTDGSGRSEGTCLIRLFWLLQEVCSITFKRKKFLAFCRCWKVSGI